MEQELTTVKIKTALKRVLKAQNYTYKDLADALSCSLPTAKRILNQEELSLSRLTTMLRWLDVSLKDLDKLMDSAESDITTFNKEQDAFLAENPLYFSYLIKLRAGEDPDVIAKKYNLNQRSSDKYLLRLEQLELIKVTGTGKVKIPSPSPTGFCTEGKMAKKHFNIIIDNGGRFFKKFIEKEIYKNRDQKNRDDDEHAGYVVKAMHLSKETYKLYEKKLMSVFYELVDSAKTDEKIHSKEDLHSSVVILASSIGSPEDQEFQEILNTFGDPENL